MHRSDSKAEKKALLSKADVPLEMDYLMFIAHLTQIPEHLNFSAVKLKNKKLLEIANLIDKIRIKHLERIAGKLGGELYCNVKHKLSSMIRVIETGDKLRREGNFEAAMENYKDALAILQSLLLLFKLLDLKPYRQPSQ